MIITLWAILLGFSFLILVLGHFTNMMMSDIFVLIGYFLIFMLGGIMVFNGVKMVSGESVVTSYTYTSVGNETVVNSTSITRTNDYEGYTTDESSIIRYVDNSRMIGLFILLIGAFGFITFWIDNRKYKQLKHEEFEEVGFEEGFKEGGL